MLILKTVNTFMFALMETLQGEMVAGSDKLSMMKTKLATGREKFLNGNVVVVYWLFLVCSSFHYIFSTDWYKDKLTDAELDELENPKPKVKNPQRTKGSSRRKQSKE